MLLSSRSPSRSRSRVGVLATACVLASTVVGALSPSAAASRITGVAGPQFVPAAAQSVGGASAGDPAGATSADAVVRTLTLAGGNRVSVTAAGKATETDTHGQVIATRYVTASVKTALGRAGGVPDDVLRSMFSPAGEQAGTAHAYSAGTDTAPVGSQSTGGIPLPAIPSGVVHAPVRALVRSSAATALPTNFAVADSLSAWLNGNGIDAMGAYATLTENHGQLPGTGEIITNVSVGDLTDQTMAEHGDQYVQAYGPTTIVRNGQRYLDLPSMPLIPTYVADANGSLNPTGHTEGVDPTDGEIMLDFGVMAPLPHDRQRRDALGSGATDLLGVAPGASYRLVVPSQPTLDQIATAMLAAARQTPRPNVITASLGEGTDQVGFPGRYLEDDPLLQSTIATIVHRYGIVVTISANDGTRLFTPTAVNPDGGSTATDVTTSARAATSVDDDSLSTTPSKVRDSGAIDVGGTTLDDVLTQPGQPTGTQVRTGTFAATRINGSTDYSSGFGSRVNVSAPGDGIDVFEHTVGGTATDVTPELTGGTSASAPMVAACAAVVQQAARLAGRTLTSTSIRSLLERTGRRVALPRQSDRAPYVGPQVDLSAAVRAVLGARDGRAPAIVRVSLAHHVDLGDLEGEYSEYSDPHYLDLSGDLPGSDGTADSTGSGEGLLGPVTFGIDTVGVGTAQAGADAVSYELHVGNSVFRSATPAIRITPSQLLIAAGQPVVSNVDRTVGYTVDVRRGSRLLAHVDDTVTVGPTDGTYTVTRAPVVVPRAHLGDSVQVSYDLSGVRSVDHPRLVVSTVGHWSPTGGLFAPAYSVELTQTKGTLTLPASAFTGGGGLYGIGIAQDSSPGTFTFNVYADMASILMIGPNTARPAAPLLIATGGSAASATAGSTGHLLAVTRADPGYQLHYDVSSVRGATQAIYEISATGPTVWNALNTITNAFGTMRDVDGVSTPSVAFTTVPGTHGTLQLSAATLPTDSVVYNIRVFGADAAGRPLGEASPTSALEYDDGLAPDGGTVRSFDAVSGADSVVAVQNPTGGQRVYRFDPGTGRYGVQLTGDGHVGDGYQVIGVDPVLHRMLLLHFDSDTGDQRLETRSSRTGKLVGTVDITGADGLVLGGRVDPARHRAMLLEHRASDGADLVIPIDLSDGSSGATIDADSTGVAAGSFYDLEIDPGTGDALLFKVTAGNFCFQFGSWPIAKVDPVSGAVEQADGPSCLAFAQPNAARDTLQTLGYRSFSVNAGGPAVLGTGPLSPLGLPAVSAVVRKEPPSLLAVDQVHGVVGVAFALPRSPARFGSPYGYPIDSNATGQLAEVTPANGRTKHLITGLEFGPISYGGYNATTERRVQFATATRTGWTFSADGSQLQTFRY